MATDSETTVDFPALIRQLDITPKSWNPEQRSFEVVLSTGARVLRNDWWTGKQWLEELSLDDGAVRLERLERGMALLLEHGFTTLADSQIGILTNPRLEGGARKRRLAATATLSAREEVAPIALDIASGIKRHVSIGYRTYKQVVTEASEKGVEHRLASDWEPLEGSLVSVPADIGAGVRSAAPSGGLVDERGRPLTNRCVVVVSSAAPAALAQRQEGGIASMDPIVPAAPAAAPASPESTRTAPAVAPIVAPAPAPVAPLAVDAERGAEEARTREAKRQQLVRTLARSFKVDAATEDAIAAQTQLDELGVRAAFLEHLEKRQAVLPAVGVTIHSEQRDHVRSGMTQALGARVGVTPQKDLDERGRRLMGCRFVRMCEEFLRADGVQIESVSDEWILKRAIGMIGTSDLPKILENIQQKVLQTAYDAIGTTWRAVSKIVNATDFKQRSTVHRGLGSKLVKVLETGEIPFGKFAEGGEKYAIASWGLRIPFTFQAMRNDDLEAISETPRDLGIQAAMNVEETLWAFISGNATMADGVAVFHAASHFNDVAGGADFKLSGANAEKGLQEMQRLLRVQTDTDGLTKLGMAGKFLIVPAALDMPARKQTAAILGPTTVAGVNVFSFLTPLVSAQLDGGSQGTDRYYLAADPAVRPVFEVAFLDGNQVPVIDSRDEFSQDGMQFRCRWYWGGVVPNHRGIVRNIGQTA